MVAKSFPLKQICKKKFVRNIFRSKIFYGCKIISSKTGLEEKNFEKNFLVENSLFSKSFPKNQIYKNNFLRESSWLKMFYGCKIISQKTGLNYKLSYKFFGPTFFMVAKLFPRKQV